MGGLINVMEPCRATGGGGDGGISAADLAGGALPASLTTLATSGVATLAGLTLTGAIPGLSVNFAPSDGAFDFANLANVSSYGINLNKDASITFGASHFHAFRDLYLGRKGVNRLGVGSYPGFDDGVIELGGIRKKAYTVGTLPASPLLYDECLVTDALTPARDSPVVAGGAVVTGVRWVSPNWLVM